MAPRSRNASAPTKPLLKAPAQIGSLDAAALVGELRQLHEDAEDPDIERMPSDNELYGALLYAEKHAKALAMKQGTEAAQRSAAVKRVLLWEYLREQTDLHQAKAIEDARAVKAEWADLAPVLAVSTPNAAYNKAKRLQAARLIDTAHGDRRLRRTPEAVVEAERRIAAQALAERRAEEQARQRHQLVLPVAQRLLGHRDGLAFDTDAEDWLDEMAAVVDDCHTSTQQVSLARYLGATVRALARLERQTGKPPATTEAARLAYSAAVELLSR
ncbi:hypothetical protein AB0N62_45785 [Streptomyces sp. NPDC093982]|uniref:hypothetical protein n=1 Tax=Streptomyces sp. NPDC093982 TaxID=3155077 RepID=UPI0034465A36